MVMPITFPDGASAELVYPADLAEGLNFYPDTYGVLGGKSVRADGPSTPRDTTRVAAGSGVTNRSTVRDRGQSRRGTLGRHPQ